VGERGNGAASPPFTRSQLRDVRVGLSNGVALEAIARALGFRPELVAEMPNTIGDMAMNENFSPRDRIAAAKTFAVYLKMRMDQEKRDQDLPDQQIKITGGLSLKVIETLVTTRAEAHEFLRNGDGAF
jgi:hypothetical protein